MRTQLAILATLCLLLLGYIWGTASGLPETVATHFDAAGTANGWMPRQQHLWFISAFAVGLPLFMVGVFSLIRVIPTRLVNIPNRDYWLAPERKAETADWLQRQGVKLAIVVCCWNFGFNFVLVNANSTQPPHLPSTPMLWLTVGLIVYIGIFVVQVFRRFRAK